MQFLYKQIYSVHFQLVLLSRETLHFSLFARIKKFSEHWVRQKDFFLALWRLIKLHFRRSSKKLIVFTKSTVKKYRFDGLRRIFFSCNILLCLKKFWVLSQMEWTIGIHSTSRETTFAHCEECRSLNFAESPRKNKLLFLFFFISRML